MTRRRYDTASEYPGRLSIDEIESAVGLIQKMLKIGALFAVVGYLLIGAALFFELTEFRPLQVTPTYLIPKEP